MEKNQTQNENYLAKSEITGDVYVGASQIKLSESEMKGLAASFEQLDFEIRPDGFIYLPQAMYTKRLNDVLGIGNWALLMIQNGKEDIGNNQFKVFFDGALMIRGLFASRSCGESTYNTTNKNQSWASALEAAKSDCRVRCCKDMGIAADAWMPAYVRTWQKTNAIRVLVKYDNGKTGVQWRRKDMDPFWNEIGPVPTEPQAGGMKMAHAQTTEAAPTELPWLNRGDDFDKAVVDIREGRSHIAGLRTQWKISKQTAEELTAAVLEWFKGQLNEKKDMKSLTAFYSANTQVVDKNPDIKALFTARREQLKQPA